MSAEGIALRTQYDDLVAEYKELKGMTYDHFRVTLGFMQDGNLEKAIALLDYALQNGVTLTDEDFGLTPIIDDVAVQY